MTSTAPLLDLPAPRVPRPLDPAAIAAPRPGAENTRGWLTYRSAPGIDMAQDALQSHADWLGPAKLVVCNSQCWEQARCSSRPHAPRFAGGMGRRSARASAP